MSSNEEKFRAEYQFKMYLHMNKINETKMDPVIMDLIRDAFFNGVGQCLWLVTEKLIEMDPEIAEKNLSIFAMEVGEIVLNKNYKWN